jgi:type III secretory pathway component EscU
MVLLLSRGVWEDAKVRSNVAAALAAGVRLVLLHETDGRHGGVFPINELVENVPLARALYKQCEIGDYVPRELFGGVAEVLAYVYRSVKKVRR